MECWCCCCHSNHRQAPKLVLNLGRRRERRWERSPKLTTRVIFCHWIFKQPIAVKFVAPIVAKPNLNQLGALDAPAGSAMVLALRALLSLLPLKARCAAKLEGTWHCQTWWDPKCLHCTACMVATGGREIEQVVLATAAAKRWSHCAEQLLERGKEWLATFEAGSTNWAFHSPAKS